VGFSCPFFPISFPVFPEKTDRDFQFPISENGKYPLWRVFVKKVSRIGEKISRIGPKGANYCTKWRLLYLLINTHRSPPNFYPINYTCEIKKRPW
jgi:hypothetical protein